LSSGSAPPPPIGPTSVFEGLRPRAIAIGLAVDLFASLVALTGLVVALAAERGLDFEGGASDEALAELMSSSEYLLWSFVLAALCTALGGYVGARQAGCHHTRHGAFVGVASVLLGLLVYALGNASPTAPLWYDLAAFLVAVPCGAVGGWLAARQAGAG
jgi:putative membrane protein (TIGR04086 family)